MIYSLKMDPIGVIHTPYHNYNEIPIQGRFRPEIEATAELYKDYEPGLKDLKEFSHAILLYYFHKSHKAKITEYPFLENKRHGIFAIRSPHRPNHIGLSIVRIKNIHDNERQNMYLKHSLYR